MYSRQEAAKLKQEFWTRFGQYMSPVLSAEGDKVNWINYKTGEKHINIRMQADNRSAYIALYFEHPDVEIQQLFYEQLTALKPVLENLAGSDWMWKHLEYDDQGKIFSGIVAMLDHVNIFSKEDWPGLISFFKQRIIVLDLFWNETRYFFEALR